MSRPVRVDDGLECELPVLDEDSARPGDVSRALSERAALDVPVSGATRTELFLTLAGA